MTRFISLGLLVVSALLSANSTQSQTTELIRIAVPDLSSRDVSTAELRVLSNSLRLELSRVGRFQVLERERMEDILAEKGLQLSDYTVIECNTIGQYLGVEKMVTGSAYHVMGAYTISVRLIDARTCTIERVVFKQCRCGFNEVLTRVVGEVAAELAGMRADSTSDYSHFGRVSGAEAAQLSSDSLSILPELRQVAESYKGYRKVGGVLGLLTGTGLVILGGIVYDEEAKIGASVMVAGLITGVAAIWRLETPFDAEQKYIEILHITDSAQREQTGLAALRTVADHERESRILGGILSAAWSAYYFIAQPYKEYEYGFVRRDGLWLVVSTKNSHWNNYVGAVWGIAALYDFFDYKGPAERALQRHLEKVERGQRIGLRVGINPHRRGVALVASF